MGCNKRIVLKNIAFTDELTDALREAGSLVCGRYEGDPAVYVCDGRGFFLVKLDEREYDEFVRPITHRDPGNFIAEYGGECLSLQMNLQKILEDAAFNADFKLTAVPRTFVRDGFRGPKTLSALYSQEADFVSFLNVKFASIVNAGLTFRAMDRLHGVVCCRRTASAAQDGTVRCVWDDPCAIIMPVRVQDYDQLAREARTQIKQRDEQKVGCL